MLTTTSLKAEGSVFEAAAGILTVISLFTAAAIWLLALGH